MNVRRLPDLIVIAAATALVGACAAQDGSIFAGMRRETLTTVPAPVANSATLRNSIASPTGPEG